MTKPARAPRVADNLRIGRASRVESAPRAENALNSRYGPLVTRFPSISRPLCALLVSFAIVTAVPISGCIEKAAGRDERVVGNAGIDAPRLIAGDEPESNLARIADLSASGGQLPAYFLDEIGVLPEARDTRVSDDGTVVSYVCDQAPHLVLEGLRTLMCSRGWLEVSLGDECGATFIKEGGACTWTLATCTQVGQATSVVFRSVVA